MLGSHTGGLLGSLQPFIHMHLSAATYIVGKGNVGGTAAERNSLSPLWFHHHKRQNGQTDMEET